MVRFRIDLDLSDVELRLAAMRRRSRSLSPAFREIGKAMRLDQRDHAKEREGPEGEWPKRSPRTLAKLRAGGRRARRPLGKLVRAVTYRATKLGAVAESRIAWSGIHQHGGVAGRGAKIPARPFLWISEKLFREAERILEVTLVRAFEGGR
jgi:phage gpG-like protein